MRVKSSLLRERVSVGLLQAISASIEKGDVDGVYCEMETGDPEGLQ